MKLHELSPGQGATTERKRLGRGIGSGTGKTAGKGSKGQLARSGPKQPGFEGGQMPLARRVPKRGFTNNFAVNYACVNVALLDKFEDGATVTVDMMRQAGILAKKVQNGGVKVLGDGALTKRLTVQANKFTKQAEEKIVKAGGKAEVI